MIFEECSDNKYREKNNNMSDISKQSKFFGSSDKKKLNIKF